MHTIRRHQEVKTDFEEAFGWHQDQSYGLGFEFAAAFRVVLGSIKRDPLIYACRWEDIRRVNLKRFSYGLFYFVEDDTVVVLALLHGKRDLKRLVESRKQTYH